jgi:5-methylcytosine-specific restriction endonuclease McrA
MNHYPKQIPAKKCRLCGEIKKESQFRYIKYFGKHRVICKKCEAKERRKKRRLTEKHVKEFGVTPGIRRRLEWKVGLDARMQAREKVLSGQNPKNLRLYRWAQRVSRICSLGLALSVFVLLFALVGGRYEWMALSVLAGGSAVAVRRYFNRRHSDPIDAEIEMQRKTIYQDLLAKELQQRIEDEQFYNSPEWKILREAFLRRQKKVNGYYVCYICQQAIWYDVTIDHLQPRSKFPDRALEASNLRLAHRRCNSSKGDRIT